MSDSDSIDDSELNFTESDLNSMEEFGYLLTSGISDTHISFKKQYGIDITNLVGNTDVYAGLTWKFVESCLNAFTSKYDWSSFKQCFDSIGQQATVEESITMIDAFLQDIQVDENMCDYMIIVETIRDNMLSLLSITIPFPKLFYLVHSCLYYHILYAEKHMGIDNFDQLLKISDQQRIDFINYLSIIGSFVTKIIFYNKSDLFDRSLPLIYPEFTHIIDESDKSCNNVELVYDKFIEFLKSRSDSQMSISRGKETCCIC